MPSKSPALRRPGYGTAGRPRASRLWQSQGEIIELRDLLAPVYGRFTAGFDTADLKEVKALLHELAEYVVQSSVVDYCSGVLNLESNESLPLARFGRDGLRESLPLHIQLRTFGPLVHVLRQSKQRAWFDSVHAPVTDDMC
jgi:hypothetical protein